MVPQSDIEDFKLVHWTLDSILDAIKKKTNLSQMASISKMLVMSFIFSNPKEFGIPRTIKAFWCTVRQTFTYKAFGKNANYRPFVFSIDRLNTYAEVKSVYLSAPLFNRAVDHLSAPPFDWAAGLLSPPPFNRAVDHDDDCDGFGDDYDPFSATAPIVCSLYSIIAMATTIEEMNIYTL